MVCPLMGSMAQEDAALVAQLARVEQRRNHAHVPLGEGDLVKDDDRLAHLRADVDLAGDAEQWLDAHRG